MSESDKTKELDSYGVWVKNPPKPTDSSNEADAKHSEIDNNIPDSSEKAASSDGIEEISLDEFIAGGVFETGPDEDKIKEKEQEAGFSRGESSRTQNSSETESSNNSVDTNDDFLADSDEETVISSANMPNDDEPLDIDLSFDDAPTPAVEYGQAQNDSFDSHFVASKPLSGDTEEVDLSEFGFDDSSASTQNSLSAESSSDGMESVDLSEFGFDLSDASDAGNAPKEKSEHETEEQFAQIKQPEISELDYEANVAPKIAATTVEEEIPDLSVPEAVPETPSEFRQSSSDDNDFDVDAIFDDITDEKGNKVDFDKNSSDSKKESDTAKLAKDENEIDDFLSESPESESDEYPIKNIQDNRYDENFSIQDPVFGFENEEKPEETENSTENENFEIEKLPEFSESDAEAFSIPDTFDEEAASIIGDDKIEPEDKTTQAGKSETEIPEQTKSVSESDAKIALELTSQMAEIFKQLTQELSSLKNEIVGLKNEFVAMQKTKKSAQNESDATQIPDTDESETKDEVFDTENTKDIPASESGVTPTSESQEAQNSEDFEEPIFNEASEISESENDEISSSALSENENEAETESGNDIPETETEATSTSESEDAQNEDALSPISIDEFEAFETDGLFSDPQDTAINETETRDESSDIGNEESDFEEPDLSAFQPESETVMKDFFGNTEGAVEVPDDEYDQLNNLEVDFSEENLEEPSLDNINYDVDDKQENSYLDSSDEISIPKTDDFLVEAETPNSEETESENVVADEKTSESEDFEDQKIAFDEFENSDSNEKLLDPIADPETETALFDVLLSTTDETENVTNESTETENDEANEVQDEIKTTESENTDKIEENESADLPESSEELCDSASEIVDVPDNASAEGKIEIDEIPEIVKETEESEETVENIVSENEIAEDGGNEETVSIPPTENESEIADSEITEAQEQCDGEDAQSENTETEETVISQPESDIEREPETNETHENQIEIESVSEIEDDEIPETGENIVSENEIAEDGENEEVDFIPPTENESEIDKTVESDEHQSENELSPGKNEIDETQDETEETVISESESDIESEPETDSISDFFADDMWTTDSLSEEKIGYLESDSEKNQHLESEIEKPESKEPSESIDSEADFNKTETEETLSSVPTDLKHEIKEVLSYMDQLLENLPEEKIAEFARSAQFETYKKLFKELGLA